MNAKTILQFSVGPIGAGLLSLITLPFIAWFFTVEDVGRMTMLQVVLGLAVSLFSLSMHQAYVREYHEEKDKAALLKISMMPGLILLILTTLLVLILPFSISYLLFGIDSILLTFLLFVGIFTTYLINFLAHVIRMQERGLAFSATQIAPKLFLLILISFIMLLNITAEFKVLMLMNTVAAVLSLFIFSWLTKDTLSVAVKKTIDVKLLRRMLTFSLPLVAGGIAYWGLTTMDRLFLRSLSGFEELGIYALATALASAVAVINSIFSSLWHPTLYKWVKEGVDNNKMQRVIENVVLAVAFIWSLVGLLSFILPVFLPSNYLGVEYLVVGCIAMPLFYLISEPTGAGIGITRRSSYIFIASVVALLVNAVMNYLLIPDYGASGATIASVIAFFVFFTIKTESSAMLWFSFPRFKIYIVVISYMIATIVMVLSKANIGNFYIVWIVLFLSALTLYYKRLCEAICLIKAYLIKD
ncbi:lipopolysaccharide biosynthesis protein [Pseudoalteromonas sp. S1612]|uniref:lipopolysaccharide biosynthesis protein n=1 Tax=Pseudoalteromonas sp. S1612 TaxID=579507 RepID=UPI00110B99E4|nr:lipopolysaccharide biosynthesis protein [Pseudoalteromonas sp. S1612]TMP54722.1 polysaccharide biosynthesis family protein [Pseudoalteromonas sp. S1612]